MPYKFTIVDHRTGEPITGEINFRIDGKSTLQGWPVGYEGIELDERTVSSYDSIIVSAPGYGTYSAPVSGLWEETEFQLEKNSPVWLWATAGAAVAAVAVAYYFEHRKTK